MKTLCLKTSLVLLAMATASWAMAGGFGHKMRESVQVSDHFMFGMPASDDTRVDGATILIRDLRNRVVTANISSRALDPNSAYTVWWVIFNFPQHCETEYACLGPDLQNTKVFGSVFWAGGFVAGEDGNANTALRLVPGRTNRETVSMTEGHGLLNLRNAEIHLVYRKKGSNNEAPLASQLGGLTGEGVCIAENPGADCANQFFSVHQAKLP